MNEIRYANSLLALPVLAAGTNYTVTLNPSNLSPGATLYLILVDRDTGKACAVSPQLNIGNDFTAEINLFTDIAYLMFSRAPLTARRWIDAELIDTANLRSVAAAPAVMRNSTLMIGSGGTVPEIDTLLTAGDFSDISDAIPKTPNQTAQLLLEILSALKGRS